MSQPAIRVSGLSKQYAIGSSGDESATLYDVLAQGISLHRRRGGAARKSRERQTFWALRDVGFEQQLDYPTVEAISQYLAKEFFDSPPESLHQSRSEDFEVNRILTQLEELPETDVEKALLSKKSHRVSRANT